MLTDRVIEMRSWRDVLDGLDIAENLLGFVATLIRTD